MKFLKYFLLCFIVLTIFFIAFYRFVVLRDLETRRNFPQIHFESSIGYAPYKFSVHKGWIPDKSYGVPVFRRKISNDLPMSTFHILVHKLRDVVGSKDVSLSEYVNDYVVRELISEHDATIVGTKDYSIDGISAKSIVYTSPLTIRKLTRIVKARTIIMIAQDYVYIFDLGSFEDDFSTANNEFELMVNSFHFTD